MPKVKQGDKFVPDYATYLHRIGRAGRFGTKGIALTLYDNDEDLHILNDVIKRYSMEDKLKKLEDKDHLKKKIEEI